MDAFCNLKFKYYINECVFGDKKNSTNKKNYCEYLFQEIKKSCDTWNYIKYT